MRRGRLHLVLAILAIGLFVATNPVLANSNGGNGGNGGGNPGNPVLPEAPIAILLPLVGLAVVGLALFLVYRRQRARAAVTE
ncbi:MAG: hypothetical protein LC793_12815 [Thermomicrobia bacterium]|nr:hypothetical protein [Thermomicrobia bacterium]MCA1723483.1 hypothetical protein [Thermomicrobia bacterium]